MPDDVTDRLAALERRLDRLEALLVPPRPGPAPLPRPVPPPTVGPVAGPVAFVPPRGTLEQAIGLRWAGWAGAIVLVVGAGLGIDFAYRRGWFAAVPPAARVGLLAAAAAALIAAGEIVYRRVNDRSAVGLFAAGVAVLFLDAYAGYAFYGLYGTGTAYGLMAVATVVGAAVARRGDLVSVAALSIAGGSLAPALLRTADPRPVGFLVYLLTLQLVAVALAFRGGRKWWVLRTLSLATTALWVAMVLPLPAFGGTVTIAFLVAYAAVFHGERIASAAASGGDAEAAGSVAFGAFVTAGLMAGVLYLTRDATAAARTAEVLAMAAVAGGLAAGLARGATRAVSGGFLIQSVGLVALAVPVFTSGGAVVAGWGLLAVVLAVSGQWSTAAAYAAPVVWALAAFDLLLWADGLVGDRATDPWLTIGDRPVPAYAVMAWGVAAAGHAVATLTRRRPAVGERAEVAGLVDGLSAGAFAAASLVALPPLGATTALLAYAAVAVVAPAVPTVIGTAVGVAAAVKWMIVDTVLRRPADGSTWAAALLGAVVVAALIGVGWANRRSVRPARRVLRVFTVVAGVWAGSVAVDAAFAGQGRWAEPVLAEQVALSVLWAASAIAVVAVGFGRRLADLRYAGLALFAVTLLKVVAVDLSGVGAGYRIVSFLGLGGLLLATSVLYGRLGGAAGPSPGTPPT